MLNIRSDVRAAAEDVYFGQLVAIWARWFLVVAGIVLALWSDGTASDLAWGVVPVMALMGVNIFLHSRYIGGKPVNAGAVLVASVIDIAAITAVVALWSGQTGLLSQFFVLYYPVLLALAFVLPRAVSFPFTVVTIGLYTLVCVLAGAAGGDAVNTTVELKALVMRDVTMASMTVLGAYYWRMQRSRSANVQAGIY
jgi:hypothetical protein